MISGKISQIVGPVIDVEFDSEKGALFHENRYCKKKYL